MEKLRRLSKHLIALAPYLAVVGLITAPFFLESGYLFFTDFVWGPNAVSGNENNWLALNLTAEFLSTVFPQDFIQKLIISGAIFTVLMGGKKISEEIAGDIYEDNFVRNNLVIFTLSLFALFNPFIYDRLMFGQIGVVFAFGFLCLAMGRGFVLARRPELKGFFWAGLYAGLSAQFSNHFAVFASAFFAIILLAILIGGHKILSLKILKYFAVAVAVFLAVNINLISSDFFGDSKFKRFIAQGVTERDLEIFKTSGGAAGEVLKNALLMSGFWGKDQFRYYDMTKSQGWDRSFLVLVPIIVLGIAESRKYDLRIRKISLMLVIFYFSALILATGIRLPVAKEVTYWLFDNVPLYKGLRETQKWVSAIVIIYLFFLSFGAKKIFRLRVFANNFYASILFLTGVVMMQAPFLVLGFGGQAKPAEYPKEWKAADDFLILENKKFANSDCDGNILFLPWHMYMSFNFTGVLSANPSKLFFSCPIISGSNMEFGGIYDSSQSVEGKLVSDWLNSKGKKIDLGGLDIKYIVLAKEVDWKNYSWIESLPEVKVLRDYENLRLYRVEAPLVQNQNG